MLIKDYITGGPEMSDGRKSQASKHTVQDMPFSGMKQHPCTILRRHVL